jgi:hypothetical protein
MKPQLIRPTKKVKFHLNVKLGEKHTDLFEGIKKLDRRGTVNLTEIMIEDFAKRNYPDLFSKVMSNE